MLTAAELVALKLYSGPTYKSINAYLRGEEELWADGYRVIQEIDSAIDKSILDKNMVVFRGVDGDAASHIRRMNLQVGDRFTEYGFVSASAEPSEAQLFAAWPHGGLILRIQIKSGMRALDMSDFSDYPKEREFLLPRNLAMRVVSIVAGSPTIDMEVI